LIVFAQAMPTAVFGFSVGFFPFIGSAVSSLGFTVIFSFKLTLPPFSGLAFKAIL